MEMHSAPVKLFMPKYDRFEPIVKDHSAIRLAKECFRLYFFRIVLGRDSKEAPVHFAWGSAYHKFREVLEKEYGVGHEAPKTFDLARADAAFQAALKAGLALWQKKGQEQMPGTRYDFMTGPRLLMSFKVAYEHWKREKGFGRIEVIAVEQVFTVAVGDSEYFTSGKADQIVRWNGKLWGRDWKTSSQDEAFFKRNLEPNDQFTRYTYVEGKLAGEPIQGQLVQRMYNAKGTKSEPMKGPSIDEHTASRTPWQIQEWIKDEIHWRKMLDQCREEDNYPMNEGHCPYCPFHLVCQKPSESAMMTQLESGYAVRVWDPSKADEEE